MVTRRYCCCLRFDVDVDRRRRIFCFVRRINDDTLCRRLLLGCAAFVIATATVMSRLREPSRFLLADMAKITHMNLLYRWRPVIRRRGVVRW